MTSEHVSGERLCVGVIGAGVFGRYHAQKYAQHPNANLGYVCDADLARARDLAQSLECEATSEVNVLLGEDIDALIIATPAPSHFDLAARALRAGKHVFIEKPIALSLNDADALLARADEQGLVLQIGHQERYVLAQAGLLTPALRAGLTKIEFARVGPAGGRGEDVSVIYDLMIHDLDLLNQFVDAPLKNVRASGNAHEVSAALEFEGGLGATLTASRRADERARFMELSYQGGKKIRFDFISKELINDSGHVVQAMADARPDAFADSLLTGADHFVRACLEGKPSDGVSGQSGRAALAIALKIEQAIEAGA